ncbi:hypothetical protein M407DRAFT_33861 [Tulasnella calospora MUT 4182]|uniref:Uncharacterized protein n=1 Tax=Tulasnella calospora MUT 4182 TaxID=1051891 RepID=A0A0C3L4F1_9AGAM|nr:hypothetical protein M407DRAFT_33861 [Tulasnella calospora MUT 4182]
MAAITVHPPALAARPESLCLPVTWTPLPPSSESRKLLPKTSSFAQPSFYDEHDDDPRHAKQQHDDELFRHKLISVGLFGRLLLLLSLARISLQITVEPVVCAGFVAISQSKLRS